MLKNEKRPDHKLRSFKGIDSPAKEPEVLAIANFQNQYKLSRRDFLFESAKIATLLGFSTLFLNNGCATTRKLKFKEPHTVSAKEDNATIRKKPNGEVVGLLKKGKEYKVLDKKGGWLRIKTKDGIIGWIAQQDIIITEYTTRTLPCGSPLPAGAVCICNCVASLACSCDPHSRRYCSCVPVCTCDLIPVS